MSQQPPPPGWVPPGAGQHAGPPGYAPPPPPGPYGVPPPPYGYGPPVHKPGVIALRPLALGDFFDGAFKTIRGNPRSMVGLAALVTAAFMVVPAVLSLALAAVGELSFGFPLDPSTSGRLAGLDNGVVSVVSNLGSLFGLFATVVLNGLLAHVVAEAVLGRRTTVSQTWAATRGQMWRLIGLMALNLTLVVVLLGVPVLLGVLAGFSWGLARGFLVGVPLLLLALVALVFVQVRYIQLAAPALVLERLGLGTSLRRAGALSRGQFWRLFGVLALTGLVVGVVGQVVAIPLAVLGTGGAFLLEGTPGALVLVFASLLSHVVVGAVTTPFTSAVATLQYIDQRIRKEGLDVALIAASRQSTPTQH